jgi:alpha-tubulin suppressor-like RCC1 family protein
VTNLVGGDGNYCAVLTSGGVDCWGYGEDGELGNGTYYAQSQNYGSATPVAVEGIGGTGRLTGVTNLISDGDGYCALLTSGGVDCWGYGPSGELGNGTYYTQSQNYGSATPVSVAGVGGTGTLTGVTNLVGGDDNYGNYCALLTSGGVDCWGYGRRYGRLGNGSFSNSATPVAVEGVGGTETLSDGMLLRPAHLARGRLLGLRRGRRTR